MGLSTPDNLEKYEHFHHPTDKCFYCSGPLDGDVWVFWNGNDERGIQIWMHPGCAKLLADNLNRDWEMFKKLHPEKLCKPSS